MTKPLAWIVVGVLLAINIGIRLPGVRHGIEPPLLTRSYGTAGAGFFLAFPSPLLATSAAGVGAVYAASADNGRLAVGVTVSRLAGSSASRPAELHPLCGPTYSEIRGGSNPSISVAPSASYCLASLVAVRHGTVFSVTILSSEGPGRAEAVARSFRLR